MQRILSGSAGKVSTVAIFRPRRQGNVGQGRRMAVLPMARGTCLLSALCAVCLLEGAWGAAVGPPGIEKSTSPEAAVATQLKETAGFTRGICCMLGAKDSKLLLALTAQTELFIHVWEPADDAAAGARQAVAAAGFDNKRIVVEQGSFARLPYADNLIDLLVAANLTPRELDGLSPAEVLRVLRPHGKAVLLRSDVLAGAQGAAPPEHLKGWPKGPDAGLFSFRSDSHGLWAAAEKPAPAGLDDWTHWEHTPDNNPVSRDQVIKAPYMTQWMGAPYYITMPAITTAAGGRIFLAMGHIAHHEREEQWLNTLVAHNGYNGTTLWTRKLPDGYLAHRSAFVATDDTFYMVNSEGNGVVLLDPQTGEEKDRLRFPEVRGEWKWIALQDGVLYALVGDRRDPPETTVVRSEMTHWSWGELSRGYYERRVPWGFGTRILACDVAGKKLLWKHEEPALIDSRALTMGDGRIYFYEPDHRLGCLDAKTGSVVWTNDDPGLRELVEQPGRGLTSTPGFRSTCYALYTPRVLFFEAQTHMNIVAVSTEDGRLLWHKGKTTSNPNMLYVDGKLLVGIGPEGSILVVDPQTGNVEADLGFRKRSCARLTATSDSFFCRGWPEGLTRYDRQAKKVVFNGAFRPACNDGVVPANGLLYAGPWTCDCNLSLMGRVALCSAGPFDFRSDAAAPGRLQIAPGDLARVAAFDISEKDWPTYRANNAHSARTLASVPEKVKRLWHYRPGGPNRPTAPSAAGGFIFLAGEDGQVRALDAATGQLKWSFLTAGPVLYSPSLWEGRAYVGSGDGCVYALEAATGRLLWRFRAAPTERRIMLYDSLCSTWPVHSGVIVEDGVAYAAAGVIDYDGTYVYALDAATGKVKWQNDTSGHLAEDLRKGASAQGTLTISGGRVWMPGGNVISPAVYDLQTGQYQGPPPGDGSPKANRGEEIGTFRSHYLILGGRSRYSASENVVDPGYFAAQDVRGDATKPVQKSVANGKIPPAWDDQRFVFVNGRHQPLACVSADKLEEHIREGEPRRRPERLWQAQGPPDSDTVALTIAGNAILSVCEITQPRALQTRWELCGASPETGKLLWEQPLPSPAAAGGLIVDRDGRIVVAMQDGSIVCFGAGDAAP